MFLPTNNDLFSLFSHSKVEEVTIPSSDDDGLMDAMIPDKYKSSKSGNQKLPKTNQKSPINEFSRMVSEIVSEIEYPEPDGRVQCPRCDLVMNKTSIRRHIGSVHLKQVKHLNSTSDPLSK